MILIKWFYCTSPHIVPGLCCRQDNSFFSPFTSVHIQREYHRLKAGRGSVAAVMLSDIVLFFFHDPRNKNLSSVILISTILFLSSLHSFLIFYLPHCLHWLPSPAPFTLPVSPLFNSHYRNSFLPLFDSVPSIFLFTNHPHSPLFLFLLS